jgi:signal peptidase II
MSTKNIGQKTFDYIKKSKVELILIFGLIFFDLLSKQLISINIGYGDNVVLIKDFLYISYIRNYNAAFGSDFGLSNIFGQNGTKVFFIIITFVMLAIFIFLLIKWQNRRLFIRVMVALIIAGGIGNLYDRVFLGYVRDFISIVFLGADLWILGTEFAIFNFADSFLSIGMIGFLIYMLFMYDRDVKRVKSKLS